MNTSLINPAVIGSFMGILCGIVAIIAGAISAYYKGKNERIIRQSIIESHLDPETAKLLIEPTKPKSKYNSLTWGCSLVGLGGGYALQQLFGTDSDESMIVFLSLGIGLGLLVSFFIRMKLEKKIMERSKAIGLTEDLE